MPYVSDFAISENSLGGAPDVVMVTLDGRVIRRKANGGRDR